MFEFNRRTQSHSKKHLKTTGLILGSRKSQETDKFLYIFSQDFGRIKATAKGALKPTSKFSGTTETLTICDFELYKGPKQMIITEIKQRESFKRLRDKIDKIESGLIIAKLIEILTFESTDSTTKEIFTLAHQTLKALEKSAKTTLLTAFFITNFLEKLGLLPNFKDDKHFHIQLELKYKKLFNYLKKATIQQTIKISLKDNEEAELREILQTLIRAETDRNFKLF